MSAYIVDKPVIDSVVEAADKYPHIWEKFFLDGNKLNKDLLGQSLWAMNTNAVNQRYNEKTNSPRYAYKYGRGHRMKQLIDAKRLLYQCSEGNVPETEPLYRQLETLIYELMSDIIRALPEYQRVQDAPAFFEKATRKIEIEKKSAEIQRKRKERSKQ
jgi:hypothetical protein